MKRTSETTRDTSRLLLLIRHGKAAPKDIGLADFERILTKQGAEECNRVAAQMSERNLSVDLMLSSPADRALETAHLFARHLGYPCERIQIVDALYSSDSIAPMLAQIKRLPDSARVVAMFGHNPSFDEIAASLVSDFSQSIPKGAAVAIAFDIGSWQYVKRGIGRLQFSIFPSARGEKLALPRSRPRSNTRRARTTT